MATQPPLPAYAETQDRGNIAKGCAIGCACQIVFLGLGAMAMSMNAKVGVYFLAGWGFTQWVALGPLVISEKKELTRTGMIVSGVLGFLLSSACASMMFK